MKHSKIYKAGKRTFRYNFDNNELEQLDKGKLDSNYDWVITKEWNVSDSIGLMLENWNESPQYWCDYYNEEINDFVRRELNYL